MMSRQSPSCCCLKVTLFTLEYHFLINYFLICNQICNRVSEYFDACNWPKSSWPESLTGEFLQFWGKIEKREKFPAFQEIPQIWGKFLVKIFIFIGYFIFYLLRPKTNNKNIFSYGQCMSMNNYSS
jgi:hypothetical protein